MRCLMIIIFLMCNVCFAARGQQVQPKSATTSADAQKRMYADFERIEGERPVSNNGGAIFIEGFQQNTQAATVFSNSDKPSPRAPFVVVPKGMTTKTIGFEFDIKAPNSYAGVVCEIQGAAKQNDKQVAEDVSGYDFLELQISGQGTNEITVKLVSRDNGVAIVNDAYPQFNVKLTPGFNTYRLPLKQFKQPDWAQKRVNLKDILRKLTAVQITAQSVPSKGAIVMDNLAFAR